MYPWRKIYDERHELYWYQGFLIYILNNQNNLLGRNKVRLKERRMVLTKLWVSQSFSRISRVSAAVLTFIRSSIFHKAKGLRGSTDSFVICFYKSSLLVFWYWMSMKRLRKSTKFSEIHKKLQNLPRRRFIFAPGKKLFLLHDIITYTWCVIIEFPEFFYVFKDRKVVNMYTVFCGSL